MNVTSLLKEMHRAGELSAAQLDVLTELHLKKRYSVHQELRAAIYIGVLLITAGMGLTIRQYFAQLGDIAVVGSLTAGALAAFLYCFVKGNPGRAAKSNRRISCSTTSFFSSIRQQ